MEHMQHHITLVVTFSFYMSFIIDILIFGFALYLSKLTGYSGQIFRTMFFSGLSAISLGLHHLTMVYFKIIPSGMLISEFFHLVGNLFLFLAVYNLYKITKA